MKKPAKILLITFGFLVFFIFFIVTVPSLLSLRIMANEASAVQSLHSIHQSELSYSAVYSNRGFACSLQPLADKSLGQHALPEDIVVGTKAGYVFAISGCQDVTVNGKMRSTGYKISAVPLVKDRTGSKGYCSDETGKVWFDPSGGTACKESVN